MFKKLTFKKVALWIFGVCLVIAIMDGSKDFEKAKAEQAEKEMLEKIASEVQISGCQPFPDNLATILATKLKLDFSKYSKFKASNIQSVRKVEPGLSDYVYISMELTKEGSSDPTGWPVFIMDNKNVNADGEISFYAADSLAENFSTWPYLDVSVDINEAWKRARECAKT